MSIVLTGLNKRFGQNLVVNNVSLTLADGELFVLLGSSGSGKSTILRLIAGLNDADSGRIELHGRDVTHLPPQGRGIGFVFQNYSLFPHMTIKENIEFGLEIRKVQPTERQQRSEELLDLVGLAGLGLRRPAQLSGGQQQRVALARALAHRPEVLLLDEPFGALDVKIRSQLRESLKDIQRQLGVTTILVTHDQEEAFELADRIGLLDRGSLVEVGPPEELYHHPKTEFAAIFIGGGNVLVGRRDENEIQLGAASLPFPANAPAHDPGSPVRVLFRPETVSLEEKPFAKKSGVYSLGQGRIVGQTFTGSAKRIRLEIEGLQGTRSLMPPLAYGQFATHIEALVPSSAGIDTPSPDGEALWVGVKDFHVLAPSGLKVLICYDASPAGESAAAFGQRLAQAARGPATLLAVAPSADSAAQAREQIEALRAKWEDHHSERISNKVRQGASHAEILLEAQEGFYELVILGRGDNSGTRSGGIGSTAHRVLAQAEVPVLLVSAPRENIGRILICTAAGEPGKSDVRFGGRLARRTGATATVLHVRSPQTSAKDRARADKHLSQAKASLSVLGVKSEIRVEEGPALKSILAEAEAGDYDLMVIGAPTASARQQMTDLASQIIAATERPVVVVPMPK
jgi:sulfate/thiosulfate transport system ATP-binding protein